VPRSIRLVVWTLAEVLLDVQEVMWVRVSLSGDRVLTIWPGHAPLLAETAAHTLHYEDAAGTHELDLAPGILQVEENTAMLFLIATLDEQAWLQGPRRTRFDRLAAELIGAAGHDTRPGL
jgi:hypothetical protein